MYQLLTKTQPKQLSHSTKVPIINLYLVHSINTSPLEHGLRQCFADKNKYIKKDIAINIAIINSLQFH